MTENPPLDRVEPDADTRPWVIRFLFNYWRQIVLILIALIFGYQLFVGVLADLGVFDQEGYALNLWTEGISIAVTYLVIDSIIRSRERVEERLEQDKRVIQQLGASVVNQMAMEFHSDEMLKARTEAYRVLMNNEMRRLQDVPGRPTDNFDELFAQAKVISGENSEKDSFYLSRLLRFYERLGQLKQLERLDKDLAQEFFSRYFNHLYHVQGLKRFLRNRNNQPNWYWYDPIQAIALWFESEDVDESSLYTERDKLRLTMLRPEGHADDRTKQSIDSRLES
jgi:hypothetical protein